MTELYHPHGTLADGDDPVYLPADRAGWTHTGLRVIYVHGGLTQTVQTGEYEAFVLPLTGGCDVRVDGELFTLVGRDSVFTRVTDFLYVGRDSVVEIISRDGVEVAMPMAKATRKLAAKYGPAEDVPVDVRGAGPATRQVNNFGAPGVWDHADKLIACELITPSGNVSSYPPHKHDETCDVVNEEIYYFRISDRTGTRPSTLGFGLHRTYDDGTTDNPIDLNVEVHDGDVALVPHGYHGPCVALPGYDMYYLNVLAGPGAERSMAFCDDPTHAWVRDSWAKQPTDPRVPVTDAQGRVKK